MTGTTQSRVRLESTMLATAGYDEHRCELQLDFRDGARYQYSAVPPHLFHDLLAAPSKGSFFNRHIRGRFHHVKLAVENYVALGFEPGRASPAFTGAPTAPALLQQSNQVLH